MVGSTQNMTFTSRKMKQTLVLLICFIFPITLSLPEQGVWHFDVNQFNGFAAVSKVVYKNSELRIKVNCEEPRTKPTKINISFIVWLLPCYERGLQFDKSQDLDDMKIFHQRPDSFHVTNIQEESAYFVKESGVMTVDCVAHNTIQIDTLSSKNFVKYRLVPIDAPVETSVSEASDKLKITTIRSKSGVEKVTDMTKQQSTSVKIDDTDKKERKRETGPKDGDDTKSETEENDKNAKTEDKAKDKEGKNEKPAKTETKEKEKDEKTDKDTKTDEKNKKNEENSVHNSGEQPQFVFTTEGVYIVSLLITPVNFNEKFSATVDMQIEGPDGYLSATEWPLLPFYGVMCVVYVFYGIAWLVISACQWRDLLRIQFWIGGVIFLGMLEKAVFFGEYQSLNNTGRSVQGAVIAAEIVSCLKRTLARMLIIIVSLGFGIVKPRLGPLLHRVVGVGALYFILSLAEGLMRVLGIRNDPYHQFWLATISLAVLDSFICYWIFTSLVQTTRTLRLRRNIVKLNLYRHFTNTLIFAVIASVAFMIWSLRTYQGLKCIKDWKELWIDEAYWRLFFSVILLVIMILWRPTNNNQRYAFTPLLDAPDDEEEEIPLPDAFDGMKMRGNKTQNHTTKGVEDDLKWIDENIPSGISDVALPSLLDSDEEIMTTKFEMSKMN